MTGFHDYTSILSSCFLFTKELIPWISAAEHMSYCTGIQQTYGYQIHHQDVFLSSGCRRFRNILFEYSRIPCYNVQLALTGNVQNLIFCKTQTPIWAELIIFMLHCCSLPCSLGFWYFGVHSRRRLPTVVDPWAAVS